MPYPARFKGKPRFGASAGITEADMMRKRRVDPTNRTPNGQEKPVLTRRWWRPWLRRLEHALAGTSLIAILLTVTPLCDRYYRSLDCQTPLEPSKYILCLGGNPSRIIEAVRLLREGAAPRLVVSNHGAAAHLMRDVAIDWGAPPDRVLIDDQSTRTLDHPDAIRRSIGLNPARDRCIIVTSYAHMARSKACFERAGYRHIILREPRWEREVRLHQRMGWKARFRVMPQLVYETAAWVEYWFRGAV